jgi:hypothetical protein
MYNMEEKTYESVISASRIALRKWVMCVLTRQPSDHFSSQISKPGKIKLTVAIS